MIYVIQKQNSVYNDPVAYAGSSAHKALLAASRFEYCKVTIFKNGERFEVTQAKGSDQ